MPRLTPGPNKTDWAVALSKGALSEIPFVGALIAEVVGNIIPNQRLDRLEAFVRLLDAKLEGFDQAEIEARFRTPEYVDLLEDSFVQAARALTQERREHIATLLKNTLTAEIVDHLQTKRLLAILGELNDVEILLLRLHASRSYAARQEFEAAHPAAGSVPVPYSAPRKEHERVALQKPYLDHLVQLGLLKPNYQVPTFDDKPEFDRDTGTLVSRGYDTTLLGSLLLRMLDLHPSASR
jgi:hypothetical protein